VLKVPRQRQAGCSGPCAMPSYHEQVAAAAAFARLLPAPSGIAPLYQVDPSDAWSADAHPYSSGACVQSQLLSSLSPDALLAVPRIGPVKERTGH